MKLMDRLKKNSNIKGSNTLDKSKFMGNSVVPTDVPMLNVALTGELGGGLVSGLTVLAGPSKHFKSSFALKMLSCYLKADEEAVCIFYDTEFGSPQEYFDNFDIDMSRVLHVPVTDLEELKFDIVKQIEAIEEKEKVIIIIDSIGNLASKKEVEDALDGKSVADMTRAKVLKGLFRMVTPKIKMKQIPMIAINHTYKEIGLYPKDIVSGGTGIYYSADTIWILGRRQNKKGTEIVGYDFVINVEKSRFVKEKSKIPISVSWEGGIQKYSGLLDVGLATGFVVKPNNGWYQKVDRQTGELLGSKVREKDTLEAPFWDDILSNKDFIEEVRGIYRISSSSEVSSEDVVQEEE